MGTRLLLVWTQPDDLCPEFAKTEVDLPRPRCRTRWCVCSVHNSQLQKSPSRISGQISGNSVDISKAVFGMVIWKFESSQVSQAVRRLETLPSVTSEMPANGGLLRIGYRSPGSETSRAESEVADSLRQIFEIFPFSGDRGRRQVRSALHGRACSATRQILGLGHG